jgi:LmbE family N-acetylglucosaminyl deacetylase
MLALGIAASLAVNVAQGWSHGLVGAVVAAWPAVALVGSYELLAWIIRTAAPGGPDHVPVADDGESPADHPVTSRRVEAARGPVGGPESRQGYRASCAPEVVDGPLPVVRTSAELARGPGRTRPDRTNQVGRPDHDGGSAVSVDIASRAEDINAAAVTAYGASVRTGAPLSERKLAEMFGLTSRRWARNRMAEARRSPALA